MEPPHFKQGPPTNSSDPSPPYTEIASPPPYSNVPSAEYLNEMFRYFYLRNRKDSCKATLADFLAKNKDYTFELHNNDESLWLVLPEDSYMSMKFEKLRKIRRRLEDAAIKGKLFHYWERDVERNQYVERGIVEAKLRNEYQQRLEKDKEFRNMEATKPASLISAELDRRVLSLFMGW
ncbi:uncharacterized protein FTJAE_13750 [Fusarium tjaetaba]|uniref:Uncharacterized protein n=1 Tax=Fusarium tjaetaba TaxID=1567544 RepID=A0A8H5QIM1_9HYPO|nr:uncharacterized protein FTJAE_13750 [Fusarium tjaetaba]KAF5614481.1 hypothetical protein FTJAE_13750 [Fusarium tjaetaba]